MSLLVKAAALRDDLAARRSNGEPATVRVTKRPNNAAAISAEIRDGAASRSVSPAAVRKLIAAEQLVAVYSQGLVTDYELSADIEPIEEDAMSESWMSTDTRVVTLPPEGSFVTTRDVADYLGHKGLGNVNNYIKSGRLTAKRENPEQARSPYRITIDEKLAAELDKRGIAYVFEAAPSGTVAAPEASETDEVVSARADDLGGGWGPDDDATPAGDSPEDLDVTLSDAKEEADGLDDRLRTGYGPSGDGHADPAPEPIERPSPAEVVRQASLTYDETPPIEHARDMLLSARHEATQLAQLALNLRTCLLHGDPCGALARVVQDQARGLTHELEASVRDLDRIAPTGAEA